MTMHTGSNDMRAGYITVLLAFSEARKANQEVTKT